MMKISRMCTATLATAAALLAFSLPGICQPVDRRPHITGISHICFYATDPAAADHFYVDILGGIKGADPEDTKGVRYYFSPTQYAEILPLPADHTISRLDHIAFSTDYAAGTHDFLKAHNIPGLTDIHHGADGSQFFEITDPEGNKVQFVQAGDVTLTRGSDVSVSTRVIHVGFLVHDRAKEDAFYKGLLGFRPYWYGAMHPDKVDWVSQQVPDGHDWLEYMLVGDGTDTPVDQVDQRELGVLNHFSLGVQNMEQAVTTLYAGDRLPLRHDGPQMGKDGKWQANFYDPDGTRVEFMEFQPVIKPCCSEFTASSPTN